MMLGAGARQGEPWAGTDRSLVPTGWPDLHCV